MELVAIIVLTIIITPLVILSSSTLLIVPALIFVLFLPGYALLAALFPKRESLEPIERGVLSFALSIAVVPLMLLALNFTPWHLRVTPMAIALACLIILPSAVALWRRSELSPDERFEPRLHLQRPRWNAGTTGDKALTVVLVIAIAVVATALVVYMRSHSRQDVGFTDFYLLGSQAQVADYPHDLVLGQKAEVTLGTINHEHHDVVYTVVVSIDGQTVQEMGPIELADEDQWEEIVEIAPAKVGVDQKVEFLLYIAEESGEPYRELHLWLDVKEAA